MSKTDRHFEKIEESKARFANLPTAALQAKLNFGCLFKEAAIAARQILEEREAEQQRQA